MFEPHGPVGACGQGLWRAPMPRDLPRAQTHLLRGAAVRPTCRRRAADAPTDRASPTGAPSRSLHRATTGIALGETAWLRTRLGDHAEHLVYAYCARSRPTSRSRAAGDNGDPDIAYRDLGTRGARVALWHGGGPPELTWSRRLALQDSLAARIPWRRDFPPSAPAQRPDFEVDARDLISTHDGSSSSGSTVSFPSRDITAACRAQLRHDATCCNLLQPVRSIGQAWDGELDLEYPALIAAAHARDE